MKKTISVLFLLLFLSCSNNDNIPPENTKPEQLILENISFYGNEVTIDWNDVLDIDNDIIYYSLYINSVLVTETTYSNYTFHLEYNNEYEGKIIATDKKGGVSELNFTFESPKSKILFIPIASNDLIAYDLITNEILWKSKTYSLIEAHTGHKNLIFSGINGNALNILSGKPIWSINPNIDTNDEFYRDIITDDTYLYTFDVYSNLQCFSIEKQEKLWERRFNFTTPLSIDDSKLYISNENYFEVVDKVSGNVTWNFKPDNNTHAALEINTNPLIHEGYIYIGDNIGRFYSLNKNTGTLNWTFNAGLFNGFENSPTIYNNYIITATARDLYALDKENNSVKWSYHKNNGVIESSPFVYNDNIYIGISNSTDGSGELICFDADNGNIKWKYNLQKKTTSSPIVYENTVYIGDWNKTFYAIDASSGNLKWTLQTEEIITKSPTIIIGNSDIVIYPSSYGLKN